MNKSRRHFLQSAASLAAGVVMVACTPQPKPSLTAEDYPNAFRLGLNKQLPITSKDQVRYWVRLIKRPSGDCEMKIVSSNPEEFQGISERSWLDIATLPSSEHTQRIGDNEKVTLFFDRQSKQLLVTLPEGMAKGEIEEIPDPELNRYTHGEGVSDFNLLR